MKKFSSILPANARITTVDLAASPSRRPGAYNPFTGKVTKPSEPPIKAKPMEPVKLDKVSLSPEASILKNDNKTETIAQSHLKLKD